MVQLNFTFIEDVSEELKHLKQAFQAKKNREHQSSNKIVLRLRAIAISNNIPAAQPVC